MPRSLYPIAFARLPSELLNPFPLSNQQKREIVNRFIFNPEDVIIYSEGQSDEAKANVLYFYEFTDQAAAERSFSTLYFNDSTKGFMFTIDLGDSPDLDQRKSTRDLYRLIRSIPHPNAVLIDIAWARYTYIVNNDYADDIKTILMKAKLSEPLKTD